MAKPSKRRITSEDLYRFSLVISCELSPDGLDVIYSVQRIDRKTEKKYANLWIVPVQDGQARQFTYADQVDSQPHWSPDGKQIAFISNRKDSKQPQVYLIPTNGGEARPLTDLQGEIGAFSWSPDGRQLLAEFRKKDTEAIEREKDEHKKELGIVSRRIKRVFFKLDGYGYLPEERRHIWLIEAHTGKARQLTDSETFDERDPAWSPDGKQITYVSNRSADPDLDPDAEDLFVLDVRSGQSRKVETAVGPKGRPSFSPDGRWIAYFGHAGKGVEWKNDCLWIVPSDGSGPAHNLTEVFDFNIASAAINDVGSPGLMPATWSKDSQKIYFQVARHGNSTLHAIHQDGSRLETVVPGPGVIGHYNFNQSQTRLAYFHGQMDDPAQIFAVDMTGPGKAHQLTQLNRSWLDGIDLGSIDEVWFKGAAGNDLQGWILKPPAFDPAKQYPSILEIHGGPQAQYGNFFMHEFYFLASLGYVVYFCNPRGGQGYGEAHTKAIHNGWGSVDYDDLMIWTDLVAQKAYIDTSRMGVTGGSYGGYMTNWIIGHTQRFKAAVTQRSVSNLISMWGSSDFNWSFQETFDNKAPYESIDGLWQVSPMKYMANARTPTLVIHNQQDLRCAIEQGEQVFIALKKLGVDTEFVVFPDEPHGLSRVGRTDRRIARLQSISGWFDRYLK
jgi:dipeptidyl aminopeptidase/acylaminoacyl peptidase